MPVGKFVDKALRPSAEEIAAAIDSSHVLWENLVKHIGENYRVKSDFAFYGKNYGWPLPFRKASKALMSMYPGEGEFTVQVVIGKEHAKEALNLGLGDNARKALEEAHDFPEGPWLFMKVRTNKDLDDVKRIVTLKATTESKQQ